MVMFGGCVQSVRPAARRAQCQDHMKNIVLGMHNYATSHKAKLPGDKNKRSGGEDDRFNARFSMFADLLPFIEFDSVADRLNYKSPEPFLKTVGCDANTGLVNEILPSTTPATKAGEFPPSDTAGWIIGATGDPTSDNKHYEALQAVVPIFICPSDTTVSAAKGALNYAPVVTAGLPKGVGGGRFLAADGELIEAIWPPDDDSKMSSPVPHSLLAPGSEGAGSEFFDRLNPVTLDFLTGADGTSNTVGIVERCKGKAAAGRDDNEKNVALLGASGVNGYVVNQQGFIISDNAAQVNACKNLLNSSSSGAQQTNSDNALAGVNYLQYTCAWLGCANMMAPPNTPVCRGSSALLAQTGISGPSSYHGSGANVGVMDG
ncbi:MAG TPA: DUF1559 domain-containing protein, partial [Pirellulales bacterium]